jgi:predicted RNA binding protein YcfA (HicA-like mRNA interferase family)
VKKDMQKMVAQLQRDGWTATMGKGHIKLRSPQGACTVVSGTPGGGRSLANAKAQIRRLGGQV